MEPQNGVLKFISAIPQCESLVMKRIKQTNEPITLVKAALAMNCLIVISVINIFPQRTPAHKMKTIKVQGMSDVYWELAAACFKVWLNLIIISPSATIRSFLALCSKYRSSNKWRAH